MFCGTEFSYKIGWNVGAPIKRHRHLSLRMKSSILNTSDFWYWNSVGIPMFFIEIGIFIVCICSPMFGPFYSFMNFLILNLGFDTSN